MAIIEYRKRKVLDVYNLYRVNMTINRQQLIGEFLRIKRKSISPTQVGLPVRSRTRTQGLRREDVAELCGISTVWYSKIERGKAGGISIQVLSALNKALLLDKAEYDYLYNLCLPQEFDQERSCHESILETTQLLSQLNPLPVLLMNDYLDIIAANQSFIIMAGFDLNQLSYQEKNYLHLTITHSGWQRLLCIHKEEQLNVQITRMAGFLRDSLAKKPYDTLLEQKIAEFRRISTLFNQAWIDNKVLSPEELAFTYDHATLGHIMLIKKIWWNYSDHTCSRINIYHPQNEADHHKLTELFNLNRYR